MTDERLFTSVNVWSQSERRTAFHKCEFQYIMVLQMTTLIVWTFGNNPEIQLEGHAK